jgi:hypothetical protein
MLLRKCFLITTYLLCIYTLKWPLVQALKRRSRLFINLIIFLVTQGWQEFPFPVVLGMQQLTNSQKIFLRIPRQVYI